LNQRPSQNRIELVVDRAQWRRVMVFLWAGKKINFYCFKKIKLSHSRVFFRIAFCFQFDWKWLWNSGLWSIKTRSFHIKRCSFICSLIVHKSFNKNFSSSVLLSKYGSLTESISMSGISAHKSNWPIPSNYKSTKNNHNSNSPSLTKSVGKNHVASI
jgi:hypothetical protein